MQESTIEKYLKTEVESRGGRCVKMATQSERGWPDRLCILPYKICFMVETKAPKGGVISAYQAHINGELNSLGMKSYFAHTKEQIDSILKDYDKMIYHYDEAKAGIL